MQRALQRLALLLLLVAGLLTSACNWGRFGLGADSIGNRDTNVVDNGVLDALGMITASPTNDGGTLVTAELAVMRFSDTNPAFVSTVYNAFLVIGDTQVPLFPTQTPGIFRTTSAEVPSLTYERGTFYEFAFFALDVAGNPHEFHALVESPQRAPSATLQPNLMVWAGQDLMLLTQNINDGAAMRVDRVSDGAPTWTSMPFVAPEDISTAFAQVSAYRQATTMTVPGAALASRGQYEVHVQNFGLTSSPGGELMSSNFGGNSWFAAGESLRLPLNAQ